MAETTVRQRDTFERISEVITAGTLAAALLACLVTPILATTWARRPFVGFFVEPTLVVNGAGPNTWAGHQLGINYPQQVVRINGIAVARDADLASVLAYYSPGQSVSVLTRHPDGSESYYPAVPLSDFPTSEMLRSFWLPYLVGLVYLAIGAWMFRLRGYTRPGRAFSFFCFCLALACILLFDLGTTHNGALLWATAIAMAGGALISLALRFPVENRFVPGRPWLLAVPYAVSLGLAAWSVLELMDPAQPWAYIDAWGTSYRYAAVGIFIFLAMTVYRAATSSADAVRRQARIVLLGSLLAFIPVTIWFLAPLFGMSLNFDSALFLPSLLVFPTAVAIAIFRYRLLELEVIVNRTIFYGALTALLAGLFSALIALIQRVFMAFTGQKSDTAIVLTTLLIVAVVDVVRKPVQRVVDRQFKEAPDTTRDLMRFDETVRSIVHLSDDMHMACGLLDEAVRSLHAESGAISLLVNNSYKTVHTLGRWTGEARLCVPLEYERQRIGLLALGPRSNWEPYSRHECEAVSTVARDVAYSIRLARALKSLPAMNDATETVFPVPSLAASKPSPVRPATQT